MKKIKLYRYSSSMHEQINHLHLGISGKMHIFFGQARELVHKLNAAI
jgi:hypothetical protein